MDVNNIDLTDEEKALSLELTKNKLPIKAMGAVRHRIGCTLMQARDIVENHKKKAATREL